MFRDENAASLSSEFPSDGVSKALFRCFVYFIAINLVLVAAGLAVSHPKLRFYLCYVVLLGLGNSIALFGVLPAIFYKGKKLRRLIVGAISYISFFIGIEFTVVNEHIFKSHKTHSAVVVANHQSVYDLLCFHFIYSKMGKFKILSRSNLIYSPYGLFFWLVGNMILVDRRDATSRSSSFKECISFAKENQAKVWVFPEGTRHEFSKTTGLLPFKTGAFRMAIELQVPIFPVVFSPISFINYRKKEMTKGEMKIVALDPIPTTGLGLKDVNDLMERTRVVILSELKRLSVDE